MNYKDIELTINEQELSDFIRQEQAKVLCSIHKFDELYNGVTIKNPTNNSDALYYILQYNGITYLQKHSPFESGFVPIHSDTAEEIIKKHVENIIDNVIFSTFAAKTDTDKAGAQV